MIFAPKSIGRHHVPHAPKVLSTTKGTLFSCARSPKSWRSGTLHRGFPMVSTKSILVLSSTYFSNSSLVSRFAHLTVMPSRGSKDLKRLYVPPYKLIEATILSPAPARQMIVLKIAAWPEAVATAAVPPSRAAARFSNTATVGCWLDSVSVSALNRCKLLRWRFDCRNIRLLQWSRFS